MNMADRTTLTADGNGIMRDAEGNLIATFIRASKTFEAVLPEASIIYLALWDPDEADQGGRRLPGETADANRAQQFAMSAETARKIAHRLLNLAEEIDGQEATPQ